jgi:uncharacterized membrane protein
MDTELIQPNLHVALVHFPIGLFVVGMLIELFSFMYRRSGFRTAGRWMVLLGALLAVPVTFSGVYALNDTSTARVPADYRSDAWKVRVENSHWNAEQWETMRRHTIASAVATSLALIGSILYLAASDAWRSRLYLPILLMLTVALAGFGISAHLGGEAVHRLHVSMPDVAPARGTAMYPLDGPTEEVSLQTQPSTQPADASTTQTPAPQTPDITTPQVPPAPASTTPGDGTETARGSSLSDALGRAGEVAKSRTPMQWATYIAPPMQVHLIGAGFVLSLAALSMGLSMRVITTGVPTVEGVGRIADALEHTDPRGRSRISPTQLGALPWENLPSARFWLLTALAALLTACAGAWYLGLSADTFDPVKLWEYARATERRFVHIVTGSAIVVLPLLMAIFARFAPRAKFILLVMSLLILLAMAMQIWIGVLMLFDGIEGPTRSFNR